jgi:hypothetical protein
MTEMKPASKPKPASKKLSVLAAKAIRDASEEIGVLIRHDRNNFAKYNFVGIDQFYELVATTARKHGINWNFDEDSRPESANGGESVLVTYRVHMWWTDETVIENYPAFRTITVLHPLNGPQTFMSMESYAQKIFMRGLFKVSTGEPDADSVDPTTNMVMPRRKRFIPVPLKEVKDSKIIAVHEDDGVKATVSSEYGDPQDPGRQDGDPGWHPSEDPVVSPSLETVMMDEAKSASSLDELNERWRSRTMDLRKLQDSDPARFGKIKNFFANRKLGLLKAGAREITDQFPRRELPPVRRRSTRVDGT